MKKTVRILSLIALVAIVFACKKDDKTEPKPAPDNPFAAYTYNADYMFEIGDETLQGSCSGISVYPTVETDNSLVLFKEDIFNTTDLSAWVWSGVGIPYAVGEEVEIDNSSSSNEVGMGFFNVGPENQTLFAASGVLKREADNKISFSGRVLLKTGESVSFSGHITSKAIELIKLSDK